MIHMNWFYRLFLLLILSSTSFFANAQIPSSERDFLVELYNSTGGANWTNKTGWLGAPGTECTWHGISCAGGRLVSLSLRSNQLTGTIPSSIGSLSNLATLLLDGNRLTGAIPGSIGSLSNLNTLLLNNNQLTGSIPPELGSLSNLIGLYLHDNQLTGSIPPELGSLSNLTGFSLYRNQLTGSIPPWLGSLSKLTLLYLHTNQLTGTIPASIGSLSNLTHLSLDANLLTGTIPPELGSLSKLTSLYLTKNQLTGSIPQAVIDLPNLTTLWLQNNLLTGLIPTRSASLNPITSLNFSSNSGLFAVAPNVPPVVAITGRSRTVADTNSTQGETVTLRATVTDSDGTIATTQWLVNGQVVATGTSATISLADGATVVTFRATDNRGATTSTTATITVGSVEVKPADYLGTYNGVAVDPRYNLEVNQVGLIIIDRSRLHSCVRIFENSKPAQVAGMNKIDVTFNILSLNTGAIQIVATRPFSDQSSTDAQPAECSGRFETTTGIYRDYVNLGTRLFDASFRLVNGNTLEFSLVDAKEILIKN